MKLLLPSLNSLRLQWAVIVNHAKKTIYLNKKIAVYFAEKAFSKHAKFQQRYNVWLAEAS